MSKINYLHMQAPENWINDPNGLIWFKGLYHLYYQSFPYATEWGTMHWGHAVSKDLVNWEHFGIALYPSKAFDRNGCFSGSAIEVDDQLHFYYTGVRYLQEDPENIHVPANQAMESCQVHISSDNGFRFDNKDGKTVTIPVMTDPLEGHYSDTRDPKVWRSGDDFYMVLATKVTAEDGQTHGRVNFYKSKDATNWLYMNCFDQKLEAPMWECPDLFQTGDRAVLMVSSMAKDADGKWPAEQSYVLTGDFDEATCALTAAGEPGLVDYGKDLYAPQSTLDEAGRRIVIGWMRMPEPVKEKRERPWIGMMTTPRVVETEGDHVCFRMHPNIKAALKEEVLDDFIENVKLPCRVHVTLRENEHMNISGYKLRLHHGSLVADRTLVYPGGKDARTVSRIPDVGEKCTLDIILSEHMVETFVNEGRYVMSHIVYGFKEEVIIEK